MRLTEEQHLALGAVAAADEEWRHARQTLEARIRAEFARSLAALAARRLVAVRAAAEAGVPKRRIGVEGLHTSNPSAVYALLSEAGELLPSTRAAVAGAVPASAEDCERVSVQPGEFLARTVAGLVLWSPAFDLSGVPAWHVLGGDNMPDAAATDALRADPVLLSALEGLRGDAPETV